MKKHDDEITVERMEELLKDLPKDSFIAKAIQNELKYEKRDVLPLN